MNKDVYIIIDVELPGGGWATFMIPGDIAILILGGYNFKLQTYGKQYYIMICYSLVMDNDCKVNDLE